MSITQLASPDKSRSLPAIDASWQEWIDINLRRQCDVEGMVKAMAEKGFQPEQARQAILRKKNYTYQDFDWMNGSKIKTFDRDIIIHATIDKPKIAVLDNVLSPEECLSVIELAKTRFKVATTVDVNTGQAVTHEARTGEAAYFGSINPLMAAITRRCSEIMRIPEKHGEEFQVAHYSPGQRYKPHFDYFPPSDKGSHPHLKNGGQRCATLLIYLNEVEEGGTTSFPRINFKVHPHVGRAVYFHYSTPEGQVDPLSEHGGDPVIQGEKFIMTKWMRLGPRN